ncbi:MAG: Ribosome-binding ATPase YchF [candidate division TA06 bacterium ADurb.Bin131]|jgi:hypothetical protein|uniref:Ribosome-binding ATPase YchF n=1 Tax=candidate division TA06 bacterium ADurb.Bin131 TaxID=1852827 RepID=A0A1V6C8E7_UNCT6|nr:MAG: Ribosome-binding ATPase YchF [candidate division TA06 bacterium ADurb.Bin131]HOC03637.1 DUF933 domain-containing protein [bacterium]
MKIGLLGYTGSGKTTLVSLFSGKRHESFDPLKPSITTVKMPDKRLKTIVELIKPQKATEPEITFIDIKGCPETTGLDEKTIEIASQSDRIAFVVNAFTEGKNPCNELDSLYLEMVYRDQERLRNLLEKRQQEILHGKREKNEEEERILKKCQGILEQERFLSSEDFDKKQNTFLVSLGMITAKRFFVIANGHIAKEQLEKKCKDYNLELCRIDVNKHSEEDIELFSSQILIATGLLRFYTVDRKETKVWLLPVGSTMLDAAAAIHTDIAASFIRADAVGFDDFISTGSLSSCREKGIVRSEGKTGIVKDGDIIHIHSTR